MRTEDGKDPVLDVLTDLSPGVVTSYLLIVECVDADGDNAICIDSLENQTTAQTLGLMGYARTLIENELRESLRCKCDKCSGT